MKYRPEIDGLRAIAVLSVLFYHAGFTVFGGGYVGVDVFFVISGYLITSLIVREINTTGGFRFGTFYLRRIRRLFPALLNMILFTWVGAFLFFSPAQMQDFGASTIAALTSISNVYFWFEADYFDAAAVTKPLLHTWSLSVEEQFYFIWPALIVFVFAKLRNVQVLIVLGIICLGSLGLAEYWLQTDRDAAFYLLPARVVELGIGAALVWLPKVENRSNALLEVGALTGLAVITWSIFAYSHDTLFPGITSLWPALGTALFIACSSARFSSYLLRTAPMVWVGKISYSLYLVHWPIIVFYAIIMQQEPDAFGRWLIVGLSIALGWAQFRYIETRFRHGVTGKDLRFAGVAALCAAFVAAPSAAAYSEGMKWRVPESRLIEKSNGDMRRDAINQYCKSPAPQGTFAGDNHDLLTCQNYRGSKHNIIVWGDSHALHLAAGLSENYKRYNVHVAHMSGCTPQSGFGGFIRDYGSAKTDECIKRNRDLLEALKSAPPGHVLLTSAKRSTPAKIAKATQEIMAVLKDTDHSVKLLADFIRPGRSLVDCVNVPNYLLTDAMIERRCTGSETTAEREMRYNDKLAKLIPEMVRVNDLQCDAGSCRFFDKGRLLYRDSHHFNIAGSVLFTKMARSRLKISTKGWNTRFRRYKRSLQPYLLGDAKQFKKDGVSSKAKPSVKPMANKLTTGSIKR